MPISGLELFESRKVFRVVCQQVSKGLKLILVKKNCGAASYKFPEAISAQKNTPMTPVAPYEDARRAMKGQRQIRKNQKEIGILPSGRTQVKGI